METGTKLYLHPERNYDCYVSFTYENETEKLVRVGQACYREIFFGFLDKKWTSILLKEAMIRVPFDEPEIKRWVDDLNEVGFPCHLEEVAAEVKIRLVLSEFKSRLHLASTLSLLRCLWEFGCTGVVDFYLHALDKNSEADKLDYIQTAHKQGIISNGGHTVTFAHNGRSNVAKTLLLARMHEEKDLYTSTLAYGDINRAWRAPESISRNGYSYE